MKGKAAAMDLYQTQANTAVSLTSVKVDKGDCVIVLNLVHQDLTSI